jgi:rhodanese-related sulfurtransferase
VTQRNDIDAKTLRDMLERGERAMEGLELPEGTPVVTFCNRGTSGAVAAEQLRRRGYEAYSLEGGLEAWKVLQRARA